MNDKLRAELEREFGYRWSNVEFSKRYAYTVGFDAELYAKIDGHFYAVPVKDIVEFYAALEYVDWDYIAQKTLANRVDNITEKLCKYLFKYLTAEQEEMLKSFGCIEAYSKEQIESLCEGVKYCKLPIAYIYGLQLQAKPYTFDTLQELKDYLYVNEVKYVHDVKILPDDTIRIRIMEPQAI